ncbi:YcnI family protein [Cellulosimicrobium cellulans]|uniref:YcnI family copper-binding membrane protein n=1 Tax=Cellulosimicrobium cellulans TaxID=1710 RepID=UPI001964E217|nr:YcnI family protein [Cellulosimicrobium cellulans]MBN0038902.1 YcnI family protein [Cellulosimicrobium cellulans]
MRKTLRAVGAAALTTGIVVVGAGAAAAHVTVIPDTTDAGAYALLTFGVPHGCGDSPTTKVSIQVPEQVVTVTPTVNPGWDVEKVMADLAEPVDDGHGGQYTERVAEVVYTAKTPLPDGYRDALVLSLKLPDAAGETLVFPTVQECAEGESAWVQVPADGEDGHDLELPAPLFELTAAGGDGHDDAEPVADDADAAASDGSAADGAAAGSDGAPAALTWAALVLAAAGLVLGALGFVRSRPRA